LHVERRFEVALCGYYGFGNLGDELLAQSAVRLLEQCGVQRPRIIVLSNDAAETERFLGTSAVNRWDLRAVFTALRESRTLLLGGGGLFQDSTSFRSPVYYWSLVRMAKLVDCLPWCFGQSVGPLNGKLARVLARDALALCRKRGVRDRFSLEELNNWGLDAFLSPDLVFGLEPFPVAGEAGGTRMILNIRPWKNGLPERLAENAQEYARALGLSIRGISLAEEDTRTMEDLARRGLVEFEGIDRWDPRKRDSLVFPEGCRKAVGMRLHFCILSAMAGIPLLAVPYDPKVLGFAEILGVPTWNPGMPFTVPAEDSLLRIAGLREEVGRIFKETYQSLGER
jgi:polysaccharide pyruvyl transferase CsaB